ncbi:hypothetical protein Pla22_09520 [Rubripirellula amarantea]|uniref:Alpha/beta hydrolase family protein n=1 Tax=Rubripirellula amarantea TaxID=2527999 RepID=A0A5C5WTH5_9BACT|nr:alpha/beta hydrolase [Rubripirellula amarantea]TWT53323.1 hypothetical protein Pla22_09520 [Rubripirellula amarantea]
MLIADKSNRRFPLFLHLGLLLTIAANIGSLTGCSQSQPESRFSDDSPIEMSSPDGIAMEAIPARQTYRQEGPDQTPTEMVREQAFPPVAYQSSPAERPSFSGVQTSAPMRIPSQPDASSGFATNSRQSVSNSFDATSLSPTASASNSFTNPNHANNPRSSASSNAAAPAIAAPTLPATAIASTPATSTLPDHVSRLPAGSERNAADGFATVRVFYATDRKRDSLTLDAISVSGQKEPFIALTGCSILLIGFGGIGLLTGRTRARTASLLAGCVVGCGAVAFVLAGQANIEKHGVTYAADRGSLVRGICDVTVPDTHSRGLVERPSLLRLEFREDQREHIVLTSATELSATDFHHRLANTVDASDQKDLLVFIHGYNVDFESAVQRTAQIAVDLPFTGTPICYSWPSQATLLGYSIDENNAVWTVTHLKQFLLELARESGARSINVVAHSMGNRAMTAAIQQIDFQLADDSPKMFDRVVLAAPDVDADHFRRDLAPSLLNTARQVTLYASSDDQALIASKQVHGYPRAGESGPHLVVVPGIETIDVSGIDLSLLGHSYYGDNESMLRDLYEVVGARLPASSREQLIARGIEPMTYWQLAQQPRTTTPAQTAPLNR